MIRNIFLLVVVMRALQCHPVGQSFRVPEINVSPPEEINRLAQNHRTRSIDTKTYASNNIDDTVKEVEDIIKSNPALPRLTRGEILDLLENITKTDMEKLNLYGEERDPKAIMVVMPFTPSNNDASNMEDLYTKAPITHIIGGEPFKKTENSPRKRPIFRRKPTKLTDQAFNSENQLDDRKSQFKTTTTSTEAPKTEKPYKSKQESYEKKVHSRRRKPPVTTEAPTTPKHIRTRPIRRRPTTTTTTQHPNHKYPEESEEFVPSIGMRIVNPPRLVASEDNISDLHLEEDTKQEVYLKPEVLAQTKFKPVKEPVYHRTTTEAAPLADEINIPEHLRPVMAAMNLEEAIKGDPPKISEVKPFKLDEAENIKAMLASIGVVLPSTTSPTSTLMPDVKNVADTLSPDMKDLLMSFGLIPNPNPQPVRPAETDVFYPTKAEVKPESYIGFKPLPDDSSSRNEMHDILESFGLLHNNRDQKSLKKIKNTNDDGELNFDMVPESLRGVLSDIGLTDRQGRKIRTQPMQKTLEKQHVFNPAESQYASDEEIDKLNKLLDMIKQLEKLNGTATDEDLKQIDLESLKDLVGSLNTNDDKLVPLNEQKNSPNPLNYDGGLSKNEVKRQESTTVSTTTTTTATVETSTTEQAKTPLIQDLEDSFGGQSDAVSETAPPETTTEAKRTGFYYLVDWNTFLDIDDQKGKRVNLRLQPTIGDPKRFLSVSVP